MSKKNSFRSKIIFPKNCSTFIFWLQSEQFLRHYYFFVVSTSDDDDEFRERLTDQDTCEIALILSIGLRASHNRVPSQYLLYCPCNLHTVPLLWGQFFLLNNMNTISSRWKLQRPGDSGLNEDILSRFEPTFQQDLKDTSIQPSYKYKALYFFSHWVVSLGNRETVGLVVVLCLDKDRLDWIF